MSNLLTMFNPYDRKARLAPVLLAILPMVLGISCWVPVSDPLLAAAFSIFTTLALSILLMNLSRDKGRSLEPKLFDSWGGKPSIQMLSYQHSAIDIITLKRIHNKLSSLDANIVLPKDDKEEGLDPDKWYPSYEAANQILLNQSKNRAENDLLFNENINYGFRRNTFALKALGVVSSSIGLILSLIHAIFRSNESETTLSSILISMITALLLFTWIMAINSNWVKSAAENYARQLVLSIDK